MVLRKGGWAQALDSHWPQLPSRCDGLGSALGEEETLDSGSEAQCRVIQLRDPRLPSTAPCLALG